MHAFGFVTLLCACHADAPPQDLTFRQVMQYPKALRDKFVSYWLDHLPDTSEHEVIDIKKMQYWTRSEKKNPEQRGQAPHGQDAPQAA